MSGGGTDSSTTTTPSPYDIEKGKTAGSLFNLIFPSIISDLYGGPSEGRTKSLAQKNKERVMSGSASGLASGSPGLVGSGGGGGASPNMLNMAVQLYGQQPTLPGSSSKSESTKPGMSDYASMMASIAELINMYKKSSSSSSGTDTGSKSYSDVDPYA